MTGTDCMVVQQRDTEFLRTLSMLRVIDHQQAMAVAGFGSRSRANKRLLKLTRAGLLRRFFLGSGGGRKALYSLSEKGAHLAGVPMHGLRRPKGAPLVADFFVEHQLAVNAIYCVAKFGKIPVTGAAFNRWMAFHQPLTPELRLIPDGYVEFTTRSEIQSAFLEVDLGHESGAVWREKTRQYLQLALTGAYQQVFKQDRFRVLVVTNSMRRMESLRKTVAAITEKIFRFATIEDARAKFFDPIWTKPVGNQREPLIDQTL